MFQTGRLEAVTAGPIWHRLGIVMDGAPVCVGEVTTSSDDSHDSMIQSALCRRLDNSLWQAWGLLLMVRLFCCAGPRFNRNLRTGAGRHLT